MSGVSFMAQFEAVEEAIGRRQRELDADVARGTTRRAVADFELNRLRAVRRSVLWLLDHADEETRAALTAPVEAEGRAR